MATTQAPTRPPDDSPRPEVCVISGDVVESSALEPELRARLLEQMKAASAHLQQVFGPAIPLAVDVYGGDSWQLMVTRPHLALRVGLSFRAFLLATVAPESRQPVDTRLALAFGSVDLAPRERVSEGEGSAFRLSGRALEEMRERRMVLVSEGQPELGDWDVAVQLLDELMRDWTARQARAMIGAFQGWTQDRIAGLWDPRIAQPTVANHLRAARSPAFLRALERFEARLLSLEPEATPTPEDRSPL